MNVEEKKNTVAPAPIHRAEGVNAANSEEHIGTVHGAIASGERAAREIIERHRR
jgi:monoamine oxidase